MDARAWVAPDKIRDGSFRAEGGGMYGYRGYGETEDNALADWARKNGVKMWNEEQL